MGKQGEIDYLKNLGIEGQKHATNKPFSDENCGQYLVDLGTIISLMPKPPSRVLDLGVGTGWTSMFYARRGYQVVGQDIAPDMISLANKMKENSNLHDLEFISSDFEEMPFSNEFDVAIFYDSLHHSIDEEKAMKSAFNALKRGGILITVEPGEGHAISEGSKKAIEEFGVTEKDMPPHLIISIGKKIGFCRSQVYLRSLSPIELPVVSRYKGVLRMMLRLGKRFFRKHHLRITNIVVLTK